MSRRRVVDEPAPDDTRPDGPDDAAAAGEPAPDGGPPEDDAGDDSAGEPSRLRLAGDGAGWLLGILLWGMVGLPFVKGGPAQVKKVWLAKFFNKAPDGSYLP